MKTMKKTVIWPTDEEDAAITAAALQDEDNPPLTDEEMAEMVPHWMIWNDSDADDANATTLNSAKLAKPSQSI